MRPVAARQRIDGGGREPAAE